MNPVGQKQVVVGSKKKKSKAKVTVRSRSASSVGSRQSRASSAARPIRRAKSLRRDVAIRLCDPAYNLAFALSPHGDVVPCPSHPAAAPAFKYCAARASVQNAVTIGHGTRKQYWFSFFTPDGVIPFHEVLQEDAAGAIDTDPQLILANYLGLASNTLTGTDLGRSEIDIQAQDTLASANTTTAGTYVTHTPVGFRDVDPRALVSGVDLSSSTTPSGTTSFSGLLPSQYMGADVHWCVKTPYGSTCRVTVFRPDDRVNAFGRSQIPVDVREPGVTALAMGGAPTSAPQWLRSCRYPVSTAMKLASMSTFDNYGETRSIVGGNTGSELNIFANPVPTQPGWVTPTWTVAVPSVNGALSKTNFNYGQFPSTNALQWVGMGYPFLMIEVPPGQNATIETRAMITYNAALPNNLQYSSSGSTVLLGSAATTTEHNAQYFSIPSTVVVCESSEHIETLEDCRRQALRNSQSVTQKSAPIIRAAIEKPRVATVTSGPSRLVESAEKVEPKPMSLKSYFVDRLLPKAEVALEDAGEQILDWGLKKGKGILAGLLR